MSISLSYKTHSRTSFIFKYKTSTLPPLVKPHNILNLAVQNVFYVKSFKESAFLYNTGSTFWSAFDLVPL